MQFYNNAIFWIEVDKIKPNPFQPRREFDEAKLKDLSESIRMYGILQPLVVTRREIQKEDGGLVTEYELISGERRLRASKLASLREVPAIIRENGDEAEDRIKLELAIIENLQREDLNAVDRARAFERLVKEFSFKHTQIAIKVGKSREYVSNTLRILLLNDEILLALSQGKISEGHTRPLLMLVDRPAEQNTLFREIMLKGMTVREAEASARHIAVEKARKLSLIDPKLQELEDKLTETLGTRVRIEKKQDGGKVVIDFFSEDDLNGLVAIVSKKMLEVSRSNTVVSHNDSSPEVGSVSAEESVVLETSIDQKNESETEIKSENTPVSDFQTGQEIVVDGGYTKTSNIDEGLEKQNLSDISDVIDDRSKDEIIAAEESDNEDLYSIKNFSL